MLEELEKIDAKIFLFLNGLHHPFFDFLMYWFSHRLIWIPVYIFILYIIFSRFGMKKSLWLMVFCLVAVALANTVSVIFFKEVFQRYRPCHNEFIKPGVHLVPEGSCGGQYGFVSSHAVNFFTFCTFLWLLFRKYYRYAFPVFFGWALIVSYSRIYLGVHYPSDIFAGGLIGVLFGITFYWLYLKWEKKLNL